MATRPDSGANPRRRITTYSKHFKRRAQPEECSRDGRATAPVESSVWDFHEDEDEIASPDVTIEKLKQRTKPQPKLRPITEIAPRPSPTPAYGSLANPRKRRASIGGKEVSYGTRAFSTPPSPPSSAEDRMPPPPRAIPLPKPIKAAKPARRGYSLGAKKSPTTEAFLRGAASTSTSSSRPFTFAAGKSVNDLTSNKPKKLLVQTQIPFRPSQTPRSAGFATTFSPRRQEKRASTSKLGSTMGDSLHQTAPRKKRRLIDELAAQADESSSEEEAGPSRSEVKRAETPEPQGMSMFESPTNVPSTPEPSRARTYGRPDSAKKKTGPKFTYSARRTIRAENSLVGGLDTVDENAWLKESLLPTSKSQFDMDEDEDEPFTTGAVRSIHELRQAGANSRSADEIEDLLTRVGRPSGKPSSSRRNALIELSQKMQDKNFVRKFRDHNGDRSLFEQIGRETDIITGYALVAILTTLVATTASTHIVSQLQDQGFSVLLERLLKITTDVQALARDRASNLSRNGQQSMMKLKASLLILPIWEPTTPFMLSPRRLALKALELVIKNAGTVGDEFFSPEVTDLLFSLLTDAPVPDSWAYPHQDESIDFQLALTLLESHSMVAMQGQSKERWTFKYLPIIADTLATTLRLSNDRLGEIGMLVLKFALNTSNNNHDAPMAFIEKGTVRILANRLCDTFVAANNSVYNADAFQGQLEALLLMLGVMINFSENDRATGRSLLDGQNGQEAPLNRLIKLFLDHHVATSEADSVEKSQLNVGFGYMSLLLGYMSLYEPVRQRFGSMHKGGNLAPLLDSIREFITYHRVADNAMTQDGGDPTPSYSNFTTKLQGLVERLEDRT